MKRLTSDDGRRKAAIKRVSNEIAIQAEFNIAFQRANLECEIYNKLADHEDQADEIGIDLVTFVKVIDAVIRQKNLFTKYNNEIKETNDVLVGDKVNGLHFIYFYWDNGEHLVLELNEYGKTWALTREELE